MRALALVGLLAIASVVASSPSDHVDLSESRCMDCHAPGKWSPPMTAGVVTDVRFVDDGGWFLEIDFENQWRDEMRNVSATAWPQPLLMPRDAMDIDETESVSVPASAQASFGLVEFDVPADASSLAFSMDEDSVLADFTLEVIPAGGEPTTRTTFDADDLAVAPGRWSAKVSTDDPTEETEVRVTMTGSTGLVARGGDVEAGGATTLRWAVDPMEGTVLVSIYYDTYYDHVPPTPSEEDLDHLLVTLDISYVVEDGTPMLQAPLIDEPDEQAPGLPLVAVLLVLFLFGPRPKS